MRGEGYLRAIAIVLCGMVACYFVFSVLRAPKLSYTVYKAVLYEVGDGISTSGFVVREEELLPTSDQIVVLTRSEGERVGKGQTVAQTYTDSEAQQRQASIRTLEKELEQMEYAYSFSESDAESATLDAEIIRAMHQISVSVNRRDLDLASDTSDSLKSYVLRRYLTASSAALLWERITDVRSRLNAVYAQEQTVSGDILADQAGYFSSATDGYEAVLNPEFLETVEVGGLDNVEPQEVPQGTVGKLVTSPKWYYVTEVDAAAMEGRRAGHTLQVSFVYDLSRNLYMQIERLTPSRNGRSILVLSSEDYIKDALAMRSQSAQLIFADRTGLRVPKTAFYVGENGDTGVYVLVGAEARWKSVEVIYDTGEYYIVKLDKSSTDNLWPEDEVILTQQELYDGKVILQ